MAPPKHLPWSPHDNRNGHFASDTESDAALIQEYLRSGHGLRDIMGVADDAIGSKSGIVSGYPVLTDGEWAWRKDLDFYVREYKLTLAGEFLLRMRNLNHVVPDVSAKETARLADQCADSI